MVNDPIPEILFADFKGRHNSDLLKSGERLKNLNSSRDLSTICIIPNNGTIASRVTERWLGQISQMNQKFVRLMMVGMEKYYGFNTAIEQILATPQLNTFKYILTLEENIIPPYDALIKLFEGIEKYDVVGALSFTKGVGGHPMAYGNPYIFPLSFTPVPLLPDTIQECLGLGTGYTLFKMDIFKNPKLTKPWFKTENKRPDISFFENIHKLGYKVACDTRVKVGNYDIESDIVW